MRRLALYGEWPVQWLDETEECETMTKPAMYDHEGYKITVRPAPDGLSGQVDVFDPRFPRDPSLYRTTSLDLAMKWIDAYREGVAWAVFDRRHTIRPVPKAG
jgi:hypothetical protein